ncbi:MAG: hypothetical protein GY739_16560 [Mesoflavibacter sp.]|nr:hypothetical protein [Mesoflavibacter sp.]
MANGAPFLDLGQEPFARRGRRPRESAEDLKRIITVLGTAGVRLTFPEHMDATQRLWPDDCPLSEAELRSELRSFLPEIEVLSRRARALYERLPEPPDYQLKDESGDIADVPNSLYFMLLNALSFLFEDALEQSAALIEDALAETPESIRVYWLEQQISHQDLKKLIPAAADGPPGDPR